MTAAQHHIVDTAASRIEVMMTPPESRNRYRDELGAERVTTVVIPHCGHALLPEQPAARSATAGNQKGKSMRVPSLKERSPLSVYLEHCRKGELAYQVCTDDNTPVFFPRAVSPVTGSGNLEWRVSKGLGTVHSTTVVYYKNEAPLNVALIDLDEGFRMMSRVEDIDPMQVRIGMRVKVRMHPGNEKQPPYPVFIPLLVEEGSPRSGGGGAGAQNHPGSASHPSLARRGN